MHKELNKIGVVGVSLGKIHVTVVRIVRERRQIWPTGRSSTRERWKRNSFRNFLFDRVSTSVARSVKPGFPPAFPPTSPFTPPRSLSFSLSPRLLSFPPSFSTLLSALGGVLFAFKWQHFNLHAKSARRPPGRHPLPLSRPDFHLNSQNGADSAGLQNFLLKDSMRITRMLGIKKNERAKRREQTRGRKKERTPRGERLSTARKGGREGREERTPATARYSPR